MRTRYCEQCSEYTLLESCAKGHGPTIIRRPPKYSPQDRNAKYRREARKDDLTKRGLF